MSLDGGYLWRRHKEFDARDFKGTIGKAEINYEMTGKLTLSVMAARRLYEEIFLDQIYSVNESMSLGVVYKPTAKIETFLNGNTYRKSFKGNANIITATSPARKDGLKEFKTGIVWSPIRRLGIDLLYTHTTTDSNFNIYNYRDNMIELDISYRF